MTLKQLLNEWSHETNFLHEVSEEERIHHLRSIRSFLFIHYFFHYPALCHAHIDLFHRLVQNRNCDHHKDCIDHRSRKRCKCSHRSRCESTSHDHHRYGSHNKFHDHVDASVNHGTDHRCSVFFLFITGCLFLQHHKECSDDQTLQRRLNKRLWRILHISI